MKPHDGFGIGCAVALLVVCALGALGAAVSVLGENARRDSATSALTRLPDTQAVLRAAQHSTDAEANRARTLAEANHENADAARGYADARLTNAKASREEQELQKEKFGWVGVAVSESLGSILSGLTCLAGAAFMLGGWTVFRATSAAVRRA